MADKRWWHWQCTQVNTHTHTHTHTHSSVQSCTAGVHSGLYCTVQCRAAHSTVQWLQMTENLQWLKSSMEPLLTFDRASQSTNDSHWHCHSAKWQFTGEWQAATMVPAESKSSCCCCCFCSSRRQLHQRHVEIAQRPSKTVKTGKVVQRLEKNSNACVCESVKKVKVWKLKKIAKEKRKSGWKWNGMRERERERESEEISLIPIK